MSTTRLIAVNPKATFLTGPYVESHFSASVPGVASSGGSFGSGRGQDLAVRQRTRGNLEIAAAG